MTDDPGTSIRMPIERPIGPQQGTAIGAPTGHGGGHWSEKDVFELELKPKTSCARRGPSEPRAVDTVASRRRRGSEALGVKYANVKWQLFRSLLIFSKA